MRHVIFNQKGGVGKSSITVNLAAISAQQGKRTLVMDLDPQCNSTSYLLGDRMQGTEVTIADFFRQFLYFRLAPPDSPTEYMAATAYDNLFVIPASPDLAELQPKLESRFKLYKLKDAVQELDEQFDEIYIDTPPAWNFYTLSALIAAEGCLIPFDCDDFSRRALYNLVENVEETRSDHNGDLHVEGIVVNQYQSRANLPVRLVKELQEEGLPVLNSKLSASVKMRESHEQSKPLIHLVPSHKLTQEFVALFEELQVEQRNSVIKTFPAGRGAAGYERR
jgi:chromosome partitioning protein